MLFWLCPLVSLLALQAEASNTRIYVDGCLPGSKSARSQHCLLTENQQLRREVTVLRKQLGVISCRCDGLGPNGGYCLDPTDPSTGGNHFLDENLVQELHSLFKGGSILDLGCGLGQYGKALRLLGNDWTGFDGAEQIEEATNGSVQHMDLSKPHWLGKQFEWVMSLEVGEHLPSAMTDAFVGNMKRHAKCGLVLSWALPGQGGHHHVNELSNEDVISLIEEASNLHFDKKATADIRQHASIAWLQLTLMIFSTGQC